MGNQLILNPYEMAFDVSYSRKLSDVFSMAVALRYIRSDMGASSDADRFRITLLPLISPVIWRNT